MRFIQILSLLLIPCLSMADGFTVSIPNQVGTTSTVVSPSAQYKGYIEAIYVDVTGTTTGTLTVTSVDETLLTVTLSADTPYRPRYVTCNSTGVSLGAGTNDYAKYYMATEKLTFTLSETAPVTNSYIVKVKFADDSK